jgi:O-antigen/teichoic acid export membrane protein
VTVSDTVLTRIDAGRKHPVTLSLATSVAIQGFNVLTGIVLARALGPAGRGELAAILLWPSILATVGSLGVAEGATYETASGSSPVKAVVGASLSIAAVQSLALIAIGAVVATLVHGRDNEIARSTYLFLLFIPLNLLTLYAAGILNGLHRFAAYHALRFMVVILMAGGLVLLAVQRMMTVRSAIVVYLVANAITALAGLFLLRREVPRSLRHDDTIRRLLGFGLRSHTTNVASLLNERLDQLVISIFLAPAKLGLYVIAVTMTSATMIVGNATGMVILPVVASLDDPGKRVSAASRYVSWVLIGATFVAFPMVACAPLLIRICFGQEFMEATTVTRILLIATVLLTVNRVISALLKAVGRPLDAGVAELLSLGLTVFGLALLLPRLELLGAGLTSLLAYSVTTIWLTFKAARALNVSPIALLLPRRKGVDGGN